MSEGIGINFWTILFQATNFFVLMYLLNKFLYKPLMTMIDHRKKFVEQLEKDKKDLISQKEQIAAEKAILIRQAHEEIKELRLNAQTEAKKVHEQIKANAEKDAQRIKDDAQSQIEKQLQSQISEIDKKVQSKAIELFEQVVQSELTEKQKKHFMSNLLNTNG